VKKSASKPISSTTAKKPSITNKPIETLPIVYEISDDQAINTFETAMGEENVAKLCDANWKLRLEGKKFLFSPFILLFFPQVIDLHEHIIYYYYYYYYW